MKIDLHLHTTFSDGILEPEQLVSLAHERGVGILSITDHDCLDAIPIAAKRAKSFGMTFIPGVELDTRRQGEEVHILGYCFDDQNKILRDKLAEQRQYRQTRLQAMLRKLRDLGFELEEKRVFEIAGNGSAGRPHLARALIEKKYVATVEEAFEKYLSAGRPAWVPRSLFTPAEAIQLILETGGIPVLAHPGRAGDVPIEELVGHGLKGIEVFYPGHSSGLIEKLLSIAANDNLLVTGGSDYHGIKSGEIGPGSVEVPEKVICALQRTLMEKGYAINQHCKS